MDGERDKVKGSTEEMEKLTTPTSVEKTANDIDDEKKSPEESKLLAEPANEVKFIPAADPKNGDAKIDMENVRVVFSGMSKEELMKFANDPFWVRMRWFLFILFWLTWLAMLAGAIAIIFFAPKCPAPAQRLWWEKGPLVTIDVDSFVGSDGPENKGTLKALTAGLDSIKIMGMTGIMLSSILKKEEGVPNGGIIDFKDVDERYGTLADFEALVAKAKSYDIKLMLTVTPNHSSRKHPWFVESEKKVEPYTDYYVWQAGKNKDTPPNNWKSMDNGSAWEWSDERNEFYLHQFAKNQPDLNFRNPGVIKAFKEVLTFWQGKGVNGFRLDTASYLLEDSEMRDDPVAQPLNQKPDSTHLDYGFYNHMYTKDIADNVKLLANLKKAIVSEDGDSGVFAADMSGIIETITQYFGSEEGKPVVELPLFDFYSHLDKPTALTAPDLLKHINLWLNSVSNTTWPNWLLKSGVVDKEYEGGLNMAISLLAGTPITSYGVNAPSDNKTSVAEQRHAMQGIAEARQSPSILHGNRDLRVLDVDVLAYTRMKSGNPGYLLLFNVGTQDRTVNAKQFETVPSEVSVQRVSPGFPDPKVVEKGKLQSDAVILPAKSALVLTFVPEKH